MISKNIRTVNNAGALVRNRFLNIFITYTQYIVVVKIIFLTTFWYYLFFHLST